MIINITIYYRANYNNIGHLHNEDTYAVKYMNGSKYWYKDGIIHRDNGPAIEGIDMNIWYKHGHPHRVDGPTVHAFITDENEWYINSIDLNKNEFNSWVLRIRRVNV